MAAHSPRRVFAAPFVVTMVAACGSDATPTPKNPPDPATSASATPSSTSAPTAAAPAEDQAWVVNKSGARCTATVEVPLTNEMPTTVPKPTDYACPKDAPEFPIVIRRYAGHANCIMKTTPDPQCDPMATCNPPAPNYAVVPCPK